LANTGAGAVCDIYSLAVKDVASYLARQMKTSFGAIFIIIIIIIINHYFAHQMQLT